MAQRRFGPTVGAGVVVIEKDAEKVLDAAPLGVTGYVGVLKKGDVGELISTGSKRQMLKKVGGRFSGSLVPDAAADFWDHSGGAGELHFVRVTDGNEVAASVQLWSRQSLGDSDKATDGLKGGRVPVMKIEAHNGGRWGGREQVICGVKSGQTATSVTTTLNLKEDEVKGGTLTLEAVASKSYTITGNTAGPNSVISVTSDADIVNDIGSGTETGVAIVLARDTESEITVEVGNGEVNPSTDFSLTVYVDGEFVKKYTNLSMDPDSEYYFEDVINDDTGNDEITVTDLNSGASTGAEKRPAAWYGTVASASTTVLTVETLQWRHSDNCDGDETPIVAFDGTSANWKYRDQLKVTVGTAPAITVTSEIIGKGATVATGDADGTSLTWAVDHPYIPKITVDDGATALADGDVILVDYFPLAEDALVNGILIPDSDAPATQYRIKENTANTITINSGDMSGLSGGEEWEAIAPTHLGGGYDGVAPDAADYQTAFDIDNSPFNELAGLNKGLVKLAAPGTTLTTVQKAGLAYAELKNWQFRVEVPSSTVTEQAAVTYINTTIGRSDFGVVAFPSYGYVNDPDRSGTKKLVSLTGAIHGREALIAKSYSGYHKAAAGIDATLPRVLELPATELNEEMLNPQGLNVIKMLSGNAVIWGDRTISSDPAWKWKHQREQMSHYENRLLEGFDWIIFSINDKAAQAQAITTLRAFFMPEWRNRALRGSEFTDACIIKVDDEINTDETRANGELYAEISLRLADTVERFVMRVGKMGLFEQVV